MRIGIVGGGVVGRATARVWLEHCEEVRVYDVRPERRTHAAADVMRCDLVFVCLPEGVVEDFLGTWRGSPAHLVLKSTVPVGTTRRLCGRYELRHVVHSPEFLTARCALADAQVPARNVIGLPQGEETTSQCCLGLRDLYRRRFPGVPVHLMSSDESEAVKLFTNAFFAVKVSFWNECRAYADRAGLDWDRVREAVLADGRIAHAHTQVPGPDGKRGWGGACLGKDARMLSACIQGTKGHESHARVINAALWRNENLDRPEGE